ncbi:MAG: lysophospholipid acyltransferase family protein [Thermodesulfobacteriota bacterium]
MSVLRATGRAAALAGWTAAALVALPAIGLRRRALGAWARGAARIVGMRLEVRGTIPAGPVLLAANHLSYLDVVVLASLLDAVFVAKSDVAGWPVVGALCKRVGTVFVERRCKRDLLRVLPVLSDALRAGTSVVVFPEGTTTDGGRVLPFKSPLFEAALRSGRAVCVASLDYAIDGGAVDPARHVCWWGEMTFARHLFALLGLRGVRARVVFGARPIAAPERKELARAARAAVVRNLAPFTRGEPSMPSPPRPSIAQANVEVLEQGAELVRRLDDATFRRGIGPQVRHCLDFYGCFLRGLAGRRVDYDARERDVLVESSRRIALERYAALIAALRELGEADAAVALQVRAEADALPLGEPEWGTSSVRRELQFLLSHTVHHHALVAELLRARGLEAADGFGVAPSTVGHRAAVARAQ